MAMRTRPDVYKNPPRIDTTRLYNTSKLVYNIIGQTPALNKPIVGANAFAHESGIHQHGVLANRQTYEIMTPESVGITTNKIVLGKHSGKHAFEARLHDLGYDLSEEELLGCFEKFKVLCDKKKSVSDADLRALVRHKKKIEENTKYTLDRFYVHASNVLSATSTVRLKLADGKTIEDAAVGNGPVDASYNAINKLINPPAHTLEKYSINAVSEGKDTLGEAMVKLKVEGEEDLVSGRGLSTDIVEASILAYLNAIEKII
jgi:2-isopropylmalate synthase